MVWIVAKRSGICSANSYSRRPRGIGSTDFEEPPRPNQVDHFPVSGLTHGGAFQRRSNADGSLIKAVSGIPLGSSSALGFSAETIVDGLPILVLPLALPDLVDTPPVLPLPLKTPLAPPQIDCPPQTQVGNGGTNHAGCNTGGVGWMSEYTGAIGAVPDAAARRHLTPSQLSMVAARARSIYDEQARQRQVRKPSDSVPANLPAQVNKADARDAAGKAVGVSGKSVDYATRVLAQGAP